MKTLINLALITFLTLGWTVGAARAQQVEPDGPVYIVQPGDTLSSIAFQFGVTVDDLVTANQIVNPNQLQVNDRLTIPGLQGVRGVLITQTIPFGENLRSLSRRYQIPLDLLERLNRVVSPAELYVGSPVVLPQEEGQNLVGGRAALGTGESLLELAVQQDGNPWTLVAINDLRGTTQAIPGDVLFNQQPGQTGPGALPPQISSVEFNPLRLVQGETWVIRVATNADLALSGALTVVDLRSDEEIHSELHFFPTPSGDEVALQGVHAMALPGLYPLTLRAETAGGERFAFSQMVAFVDGGYRFDPSLTVPSETLDPDVTGPEDEIWNALTVPATPERMWSDQFLSPSPFGDCWTSLFGSRRSYNGSPYNYFHTGLDFCGGTGIEVSAPAPGVVVFAGPLVVRGNAIMIDHGWGIYTGYMHLSEISVQVGERVGSGQVIGLVGGTGRVTGSHLHWEVWVGGVQVNPLDWLEQVLP